MFDTDSYAGNWGELVDRLDRSQTVATWSVDDPALAGLTSVSQLAELTQRGRDGSRADRILGALVRRAAGCHGDDDALLLLLHLLSDMVVALATDLIDVRPDVVPSVVDELTCQIRSVDVDRPVRSWAAALKWATRRAVLAEFRPGLRRNHPGAGERPVADDDSCWLQPRIGGAPPLARPDVEEDLDLVDVLLWAVRDGVSPADISLLTATETARGSGQRGADQKVAEQFGVGIATLYRRNTRTLSALRRCGEKYLAAVA